jgi:hypothetical protein
MNGTWMSQAAIGLLVTASTVFGQDTDEARLPAKGTPLQVQLVIRKQVGDKKLSSLSYSFPCNADERGTTIKQGVEVPVPVRKAEAVEFQYRNVGANIQCEASSVQDGRFRLRLSFEQSSLYPPPAGEQTLEYRAANPTLFRTSMSQFATVLRDGQTTQAVTGTDPVSGEFTAVDVSLTVQK